jgi:YggT family protein
VELTLTFLDIVLGIVRVTLLWGAAVLAIVFLLDWLVRTRRINPFSRAARIVRSLVDPLLLPIERRVVRGGGSPTSAPWWALAGIVIFGILVVSGLTYVRDLLWRLSIATATGPTGLIRVLVAWVFGVLQIALLVRVVSSWIRVSPYSPWIRWSYSLTEWILRPLRQIIPPIGMVDITPIVAYVLLQICAGALSSTIV